MKTKEFETLMAGLDDALAYAKKEPKARTREHKVEVTRSFVAETRLKAGLTQEEFAKATGASLGTVRKWERGERSPSGAASMLVRIMARAPELVIEEAGLKKSAPKRRASNRAA
ncbi:MAG: helix-turn-helix domain-containing protein [Beijerinckiaceae bacterium]